MLLTRPFYLLRHGQTDWNLEGRYQGHSDVPLNATGLAQAEAAAPRLAAVPIDRIVVSPLIRALKTAAVVAEQIGKPLHVERGLIERNFGSFDELVIKEVKQRHGLRPDQNSQSICRPTPIPFPKSTNVLRARSPNGSTPTRPKICCSLPMAVSSMACITN